MDYRSDSGLVEALARLARDRDPVAWTTIISMAGTDCWRCCLAVCGDESAAQDAFQETLMQVRDDARLFIPHGDDAEADARRWLKRVATTTALDLRRSRGRAKRRDDAAGAEMPVATTPDPAMGLVQAEELASLRNALAKLSEPRRTAIALHHLQGLSLAAVAAELGRPEGTVKTWIHRGLEELRTLLAGDRVIVSSTGLLALFTVGQASAASAALPTTVFTGASSLLTASGSASVHAISITTAGVLPMTIKLALIATVVAAAGTLPFALSQESAPSPTTPVSAPIAVAPVVAPVTASAPVWLDTVLTWGWDENIRSIPEVFAKAAGDREVALDLSWWLPGSAIDEPFPMKGHSLKDCCERLATRLGAVWMVHEDGIVFLSREHLAILKKPMTLPVGEFGLEDAMVAFNRESGFTAWKGWGLNLRNHRRENGRQMIVDPQLYMVEPPIRLRVPNGGHTALSVLAEMLSPVDLCAEWNGEDWMVTFKPPVPILPVPRRPGSFFINGPGRPKSSIRLTLDLVDVPARDAFAQVAKKMGVPLEMDPSLDKALPPVTLKVEEMRANNILDYIGRLTSTSPAERDGKLVIHR